MAIKGNEIIQDDHLDNAINSAKELIKAYDKLDETQKKVAASSKAVASSETQSAQDQVNLAKALTDSTNARKAAITIDEQKIKLTQQLKAATDEEVKGKLRLQEAAKKQKQSLQEEIALEDRQIGTLKRLQIENNKLRREREGLNLETAKGQQRVKEINAALDQNNAKIRANSDAMKKQRLNVGAYGAAVSKVTSIMKGFGATLLATFSIQAVKGFFQSSIEGFLTQEKAIAKVTQAIKSTEGAAQRTSGQLQVMASELQKNTLFGDEDILNNVTAQLLTFTNIAGDQFDRTQKVALDLATVLDGDLKSASIQLGKALNDPIANLSALSRSGIQFSKEQKELIKTLTESGRLAEAQNVILTELERQYGGQAEAAAKADGGLTQLKNTFGDFKEEVGRTLLEALKPTIQSLKSFFENLKSSDIEYFTTVIINLGKAIFTGVQMFLAYKVGVIASTVATKAYAAAQALATKNTEKMNVAAKANPWGLIASALVLVVPLLKDAAMEIIDMVKGTDALAKVTEEVNERMIDERTEMNFLFEQLKRTNAGSQERKDLIDKINGTYGTTLKNLEDETEFAKQLETAYKSVNKQLERKITAQVTEQMLQDAIKKELELRKQLAEYQDPNIFSKGLAAVNGAVLDGESLLNKQLDDIIKEKEQLLNSMNKVYLDTLGGLGGASVLKNFEETEKKKTSIVKKEIDKRIEYTQNDLIDFSDFESELNKVNFDEIWDLSAPKVALADISDTLDDIERKRKEEAEAELKRQEAFRESVNESAELLKTLSEAAIRQTDERIAAKQKELTQSETEAQRLKDLAAQGDVNAAKSLKAEENKIAQQKEEIKELERKKANLLIFTTALGQVQQNLNNGDKQSFTNALGSVNEFIANLPQFFKGTEGTVAESLGSPHLNTSKDAYLSRLDGKEMVFTGDRVNRLRASGLNTTTEITNAALKYQDGIIGGKVMRSSISKAMSDTRIVSELKSVKEAISNIKIVQHQIDLASLSETIVDGNTISINTYKKGGFTI